MAKEGFDWIWCEHALTVGYRSSLTEIIQIIGRATRDAPGKEKARFTNLIAEPDAAEALVVEAINDTLKAIAASLLMEQVLAPRFEFTPKNAGRRKDSTTALTGMSRAARMSASTKPAVKFHLEIKGWSRPKVPRRRESAAKTSTRSSLPSFRTRRPWSAACSTARTLVPEELTQLRMGKIVRDRYPELSETDQEAIRQHAIAALNLTQQAKQLASGGGRTERTQGQYSAASMACARSRWMSANWTST